jgi:hypothetical protein
MIPKSIKSTFAALVHCTFKKIPFIIIIICLFTMEAYMSELYYENVTIEEVIKNSGLVAEVKGASPFSTEKLIPIHPDQKKYPPYHQIIHHYEVIRILFDATKHLKSGCVINVDPSTVCNDLGSYKLEYLENMTESPIVPAYHPETRVSDNAENHYILFLNRTTEKNLFTFTVENSYEDKNMREKIVKMIHQIKKPE